MHTTHQSYKKYESIYYVMCYEVKEMKKHTVFLSDVRGRGEERVPLL